MASKSLTPDQAKAGILALVKTGKSVQEACDGVGRTRKSYENYRAADPKFRSDIDNARNRRAEASQGRRDPDLYNLSFEDWRKRFLNQDTYPHQRMWIDVLEGREPKLLHTSVRYEPKSKRLFVINTPPFHAKSTTITQQWVTYQLCMNPAFRVIIISKTADAASKFLVSIKTYLTDPNYVELQGAYGPADGWKPQKGEGRWGANEIYLAERNLNAEDKAAKDPSVRAVGIGGQIYGGRADLIVLDDAVDDTNADNYVKQFDWLTRTVMSRAKTGKILLVGTRIKPVDLYSYVLDDRNYTSGRSPWTYLAQPAVLEYAEDPADWKTLWPRSSTPMDEAADEEASEDGLYQAWDGKALAEVRDANRPGMWALVYMQQQVSEDMTFHPLAVWGSVDRRRKPGPLRAGGMGHPPNGTEGMHIIGSIDPAGTGEAFILVMAVDRTNNNLWVLNAWMGDHTKPSWYADRIEDITPEYGVTEWVIEAQGYSNWLYQDERIVRFCQERGIRLGSHYTGKGNKVDPDFGVATMASTFGSIRRRSAGQGVSATSGEEHAKDHLIHLPDPDWSPGIKALIEQLLIWVPGMSGAKLRQDGPMCLWFAVSRARQMLYLAGGGRQATTHAQNRFTSARTQRRQYVIPAGY